MAQEYHRVRELIHFLDYGKLRKEKILPKQALFTRTTVPCKGGSFPKLSKSLKPAPFGLFMDYLIRKIICRVHNLPYDHPDQMVSSPDRSWKKCVYPIYLQTLETFGMEEIALEKKVVKAEMPYYSGVAKLIKIHFREAIEVVCEPEWVSGSIMGHPDLVIDETIYDIKTTGQFGRMRQKTIFQLLAYYCLAQKLGKNIKNIGLVLPAQNKVLKVNLEGWNWKPYFKNLKKCGKIIITRRPSPETIIMFKLQIEPRMGHHMEKEKDFYETMLKALNYSPLFQIFLFGNGTGTVRMPSDKIIAKARQVVEENKLQMYVHSPYSFNLSKVVNPGKNKGSDVSYADWLVENLGKNLTLTNSLGGKGVVVHCGKKCNLDEKEAWDNMKTAIIRTAEYAMDNCPLLLETSAGETGELCSSPDDLIRFYHELPEETKQRVKICLDTCHVYAAGYMPLDFLKQLEQNSVPVAMVHFNDSKFEKGCCKDRHDRLGRGCIGLQNLLEFGLYAIERSIPLIHE